MIVLIRAVYKAEMVKMAVERDNSKIYHRTEVLGHTVVGFVLIKHFLGLPGPIGSSVLFKFHTYSKYTQCSKGRK